MHPPSALLTALRSSCTLKAPAGLPAAADTQINLHVALTKFQVERDVLARPAPELDWEGDSRFPRNENVSKAKLGRR